MNDVAVWDGVTRSSTLLEDGVRVRGALADAARHYEWEQMLAILRKQPDYVNASRLDGRARYAPLHQAASGNAPVDVIDELIRLGAWRTLQNAHGERAVDVAERKYRWHLREILTPVLKREVPHGVLHTVQRHFHAVIRNRVASDVRAHKLRLPELEPLLELDDPTVWFPVPGMYGGFRYVLARDGVSATLIAESWCSVVGGSGQRHEINARGSRLVAEGFG